MSNKSMMVAIAGLVVLLIGGLVFFNYRQQAEAKPPFKETKAGTFDGEQAIKYLEDLCKIGPRISGTEGMQKQQELLIKHFEKYGGKVTLQKFEGKQPSQAKSVAMVNLIVSFHPEKDRRVALCGHYDTRPIADQETRVTDWTKPFVSANDGGSTMALMMAMAPLLKDMKLDVGVDFIIFDGEEWIFDRTRDKFFLGSEHFAAEYKKDQKAKVGPKYIAAILLDLFAGKNAKFPIEQNSRFFAGALVEDFWKTADEEGVGNFLDEIGPEVLDDHIALNKAGIPTIDVIDFEYSHWHRLTDTPDKCSAASMAGVAKVFLAWVKKVK